MEVRAREAAPVCLKTYMEVRAREAAPVCLFNTRMKNFLWSGSIGNCLYAAFKSIVLTTSCVDSVGMSLKLCQPIQTRALQKAA